MTSTPCPPANIGFLTILSTDGGALGGYLVTNLWGRPLEFRLSSAVQPNKVQQILYGPTLNQYICGELIGRTLIEKTNTPVRLVITDSFDATELRRHVSVPVLWAAPLGQPSAAHLASEGLAVRDALGESGPLLAHPDFSGDVSDCLELLKQIGAGFDLAEPFVRIRDAVTEARKLGVNQRAA